MTSSSDRSGSPDGLPVGASDAETIFERVDDGVFALDADARVTFVNSHTEAMLGVSDAELLGERVWDAFPATLGTPFESAVRRARETREQVTFEAWYEPRSAWFEVRLYPDEGGMSAYFRDITDRKERVRQLEAYETGINAAADLVYRLDADGRYTMVNDTLVERTGFAREELLGEHVSITMDEADVAAVEARIRAALQEGRESPDPVQFEMQCADGDRFPVEANIAVLRTDGEFVGTVGVSRDISERRERERELERFEETINAVDDVVYALDDEGRFDLVNDTIEDVTGYDREALLGEHVGVIKDDETVAAAEETLGELLDGKAAETTFEFPLQPNEGAEIPAEDHMTIVYDDDGTFTGTAGVIRDITARKERQRKLSGLVETTQELMHAEDQGAVAESTLAAARDVLGFEFSTVRLYDAAADDLVPVASTDRVLQAMGDRPTYGVGNAPAGEAFETGELLRYEDLADIDDDVDRSPARAAMYVPIGEYGVLVLGSTEPASFTNLDQRVAEVLASSAATACERAEREAELREERAFIDGLVDSIPDVMYALDENVEYIRWNDRLLEATGYTEGEMADIEPLDLIAEGDMPAIDAAVEQVLDGERARAEARMVTSDGDRIPYEFTGAPVTDADGAVEGIVGIGRDVSERLERERELERQNERLERFASTVSHDLRNPLKLATSNLDMARHEVDSSLLDDVAAAHDRMEELIEDLLALARQGQTVDETEPVSVESVARDAWEHVDAPDATLEIDADEVVEADRQRLLQVFENLFRNSVEHAGPDVTLRVETTPSGFSVTDDGPGIPADERDAVFEYGYTTTDTGTGLGLAIVEEALTAHGWDVSLGESEAGGVRFDVRT
ncbi:sensor histidine kinase [Halorientalis salina]|uniref:sensor histidine kinase n=1 Tax=Halorientalis salina TaxID=2932266 RepID=UPI0010AC3C95|nr:PAS domain S-box protein [Halorientalis salina]